MQRTKRKKKKTEKSFLRSIKVSLHDRKKKIQRWKFSWRCYRQCSLVTFTFTLPLSAFGKSFVGVEGIVRRICQMGLKMEAGDLVVEFKQYCNVEIQNDEVQNIEI
jgi:hypothetical protein